MIWVLIAAAAGVALFYVLSRKDAPASAKPSLRHSKFDTSSAGGAMQFLVDLASPGSFAMTESLLGFAIQGSYKKDINTLPVSEYDQAVNALAMFGGNDLRVGATAEGQGKIRDAARLAYHQGAEITDRAYEQLAEASYNMGAVEAALITLMRMERHTLPWMQIRPALAHTLDSVPDDARLTDWLQTAVAWRRERLGTDAQLSYNQAISTLT